MPVKFSQDFTQLIRLALPIVIVQVGLMLMGVVDTMMVGRVSDIDLAAVALGNLLFFVITVFGMGALMAVDPLIAQAVGARDEISITRSVQRGFIMCIILSVPLSLLLLPAKQLFQWLGQPSEVIPPAASYALVSIPGIFPFLFFSLLRQSLQAMGRVAPIVITIIAGNLINVLLNWLWIYGHWGFPAMGAVGSGWASTVSRWVIAVALLVVAWRSLHMHFLPLHAETFVWRALRRMFQLGFPVGIQYSLEFGIFACMGIFMGWFGAREVGGHQIALNLASLTFMVPMGISAAATVLVGHAIGANDMSAARRAAGLALLGGVVFMSCTAVVFLTMPGFLSSLYTNQIEVLQIAVSLIPIAGVFQIFDGLQVVSGGILRGAGDTRSPMIMNLIGFWLLGLPISWYLAFKANWGPQGLWWGLVAGLAVVGICLLLRARHKLSGNVMRVIVDGPTY